MLFGWMSTLGYVLTGAAASILCLAALHDMAARTIPDWMPSALAIIGVTERILDGRLCAGLLAGLMVFVLTGICWRRGWLGGGDVKLLGAAAIAVPSSVVPPFAVAVALAGGVLSLIYLAAGRLVPKQATPRLIGRQMALLSRIMWIESWRLRRGGPLPYAIAIAAGGLFVLL
jgi:prepilin peptidase CpaA